MALSDEKRMSVANVLENWTNISESPEDMATPYDWRSMGINAVRRGDVGAMKAGAAPLAEFKVMEIMQTSSSEALQLDAAKYILAQAGHGPIQKVEQTHIYEKMEPDQLVAILQSKMEQIRQLAPGVEFRLPRVVDAELVNLPSPEEATDGDE